MTDGGEGSRGYKHSANLKLSWSVSRKGVKPSRQSVQKRVDQMQRKVYQFTTDGKLVATYISAKEAGKAIGSCGANVSQCCRSLYSTTKGYIFQYTPTFIPRMLKIGKRETC